MRAPLLVLVGTVAWVGCEPSPPSDTSFAPVVEDEVPAHVAWDEAGLTWEVPADLLRAVALAETGMQMVEGIDGHDGRPAAFGVMALRGERLTEAAALAGLSPDDVRHDRAANIMAAAALLSAWADEAGIDRHDLAAWAPVVARYSGITDEEAQAEYVWRGVYRPLRYGQILEGQAIKAWGVEPRFRAPTPRAFAAGPNYSGSVWRASPNYDSRNSGAGGVGLVIIHSCEGSYSGCWSWLTNSTSGVSAHYVVNDSGSEISQLVDERNRAWHVGASYDCALNGNTDCYRSGWNVNHMSVGIEHAGYASQASWSNGLLDASARLTCDITRDQGIVRDSYHIVAHGRLQPYNRTDPGPNWPWTDYINRVRTFCGDAGTTPVPDPTPVAGQVIIDSNNGYNVTSDHYIEVSANWTSSQNVSGYYQTGYWVGATQAVSDPARFYFNEPGPACYDVDAWWTSAGDRAPAAPFIAYDGAGAEVGRASVDQRSGHGQWNRLGTWGFTAGWNQIALSRWTTAGAYVIADAVRLTPSTACTGCQFRDGDGDGTTDCTDACPSDPAKVAAGACGCGVADTDSDGDGRANCADTCPSDPAKTAPGVCGCGASDADVDGDGLAACQESCPTDPRKSAPGACGCGVPDTDGDGDGAADCVDACPVDPNKVAAGVCGCGAPDVDRTGDGVPDCTTCGDRRVDAGETCDDGNLVGGDGCSATCQAEALTLAAPSPGTAGATNLFRVTGAVPGSTVHILGSQTLGGGTPVRGCATATLPFSRPYLLGAATANAQGVATLQFAVPGTARGQMFVLAAVDQARCRVSPMVAESF